MCDRNSVLVIFLILKIIILVVLPIGLYILYRMENRLYKTVGIITVLSIMILIVLRLFNNECVVNSSFSYLKSDDDIKIINENSKPSYVYESIYSSKTYLTDDSREAYFYDLNSEELKTNVISCNKNSYLNNYGSGLSAIATLISNGYGSDTDIVEMLFYLEYNKLIDCENGFDFDTIFKKLGESYYFTINQISKDSIKDYVSNGKFVLAETTNKSNEYKNFGCEKDYIVVYNNSNDEEYSIINPNDKRYSYFCPSNTIGYGSIIEKNQNNNSFTLDEIDSKALRYFVIEVTQ